MSFHLSDIPDDKPILIRAGELKSFMKEYAAMLNKPETRWVPASKFAKEIGWSGDKLKYEIENNAIMFKKNDRQTRWLIDTKLYFKQSA